MRFKVIFWRVLLPLITLRQCVSFYIPPHAMNLFRGLEGPYCSRRSGVQCCPGRDDTCVYPIARSMCYCDMFCNRTNFQFDCCPDFWNHCIYRNSTPQIPGCQENGLLVNYGSTIKRNCNKCKCVAKSNGIIAWQCDKEACLIRPKIINAVNYKNLGWQASNYSQFWGLRLTDGVNRKLGTEKPKYLVTKMSPLHIRLDDTLPESFDSRDEWPNMVHGVADQGDCAASWAFSTAAVASDRFAIQSRGRLDLRFSPQHLISCNVHGQMACKKGSIDRAWWYFRKRGVVTQECYPYHSGSDGRKGRCRIRGSSVRGRCPGNGTYDRNNIYKSSPAYRISIHERDIMKEIITNGPVQATFLVQEDFYSYKSGVYRYSNSARDDQFWFRISGHHSVRILGWGIDRSTGIPIKYWLCANTWGKDWGENGYFRILRGSNESEIESFVLGVWGREPVWGRRGRHRGQHANVRHRKSRRLRQ